MCSTSGCAACWSASSVEDAQERAQDVPRGRRSRAVAPTTGRFLFALVAPQNACEVLEIGGSRGYSSIWLAAGVRMLGGRVLSLEHDPAKCDAWRRNVAEAGLEDWAELVEGDAFETLPALEDVFDVVFLDAEKEDYEHLFALARAKLEPGAVVVADNVISVAGGEDEALARVLPGAAGRPDARERHRPARPRARGQRRPQRIVRVSSTAERRWSGLSDDSTGSGGTSR